MDRPAFLDTFPAPLGDLDLGLPPLAPARAPVRPAPAVFGARAPDDQTALLGRLIRLAADWTWEHDAQLHFSWSARSADAARLRQLPGQPGAALHPPGGDWSAWRALLATRQPFRDFDLLFHTGGGDVRHLSLSGMPVFDALGDWRGCVGVASDRTAQRRAERLLRIEHGVTRGLADAPTVADGLRMVLRELCEAEGWACGEYWALDKPAQAMRFAARWDRLPPATRALFTRSEATQFPPGVGLVGRVWAAREPLWVDDIAADAGLVRQELVRQARLKSALLFPAVAANDEVCGVFAFSSQTIRRPDERLAQAMRLIGSQVGQFLLRKQAEGVLRASEERFRALTALSSDWYWELDAQGRCTRLEGRSIAGLDALVGRQPRALGLEPEAGWPAWEAMLAQPAPFRDLVLRGELGGRSICLSLSGEPVAAADGSFVRWHGVASDITERREAEERIRWLAMHDDLTGLPNRAMFGHILAHSIESARRHARGFAVLFIDLDRFKTINDSLGHEAGDRLLRETAARLKATLRASDVVARLAGDEFVALLGGADAPEAAAAAARKVLKALMQPLMLGRHELRVTASIGIARFPQDAGDEATLLKNADLAMYLAKEAGKNTWQLYDAASRTRAMQRLSIEQQLRLALERQEFSLHYQAKLELATERIVGVEALLRWHNAELGSVAPAQFIPIAEETGLIVPIGKWVLREACAQSVAWQRAGLPAVAMAVNLSPRQFTDPNLVADIGAVLADTGLEPGCLELEITEGMIMSDAERAIGLLRQIKALGVSLAIDDFGTGYSSLAQLRRFPIDTLKVDRSFVRDIAHNPDDKAITEAIILLGRKLSLTVVAEGVESGDQMALLREQGCDQMQGYHFSKPLVPQQFAALLHGHRPLGC
ncbi:MAG TPA: EAL domain-containing protein [Rubrivivax sp.]|nr:EAL domain-containing protein [Rubrivivax sp.]